MKKFLKRHIGGILFIVPCLFMVLSFLFSPYRLSPLGGPGRLLHLLFLLPSFLLMGLYIWWWTKRGLGKEYTMEKAWEEGNGFILFATFGIILVCFIIFEGYKPRISDIPSTLDNPIVETLLSGLLVTIIIFLAGFGLILTEKWSLARKRKKLYRIEKEFGHVAALKQDPEKLILELARALTTSLLCLSLSLAGGIVATAFLVLMIIAFQSDLSGLTSAFPGLLSQLPLIYVAIAEGLLSIFIGVLLFFGFKGFLSALKLLTNLKEFQVYQGKIEKEITNLNLSINSRWWDSPE